MRKMLIILLLPIIACNLVQTKQEKAEITVKKYLHIPLNSDSSKRMKFTPLENQTIGLLNGAKIPSDFPGLSMTKTLWFEMDASYTKVMSISVN